MGCSWFSCVDGVGVFNAGVGEEVGVGDFEVEVGVVELVGLAELWLGVDETDGVAELNTDGTTDEIG